MKYVEENATSYIWPEEEELTVHLQDKEKFL